MVSGLGTCVCVCSARGLAVGAHTATDAPVKVIFTPSGSTAGFEGLGMVTSVILVNEESLYVFIFDRIHVVVVRSGIHCCGSYAPKYVSSVYTFFSSTLPHRNHTVTVSLRSVFRVRQC